MVCERERVTKLCVKDGVWQRWCVKDGVAKDGVWQSCVWKMVCDKDGVWQSGVWQSGVWQSGVWKMVCDKVSKMVCDKVVCERWCVKDGVCERWCVTKWWVKDGVRASPVPQATPEKKTGLVGLAHTTQPRTHIHRYGFNWIWAQLSALCRTKRSSPSLSWGKLLDTSQWDYDNYI